MIVCFDCLLCIVITTTISIIIISINIVTIICDVIIIMTISIRRISICTLKGRNSSVRHRALSPTGNTFCHCKQF